MLLTIATAVSMWLSQIQAAVGSQMTRMQPEQYAAGLTVCIALGYLLLRGRN